jgi:hypothetical protein
MMVMLSLLRGLLLEALGKELLIGAAYFPCPGANAS